MMQIILLLSTLIYALNSASSSPIFTASSLISAGTSHLFSAIPTVDLLTFTITFTTSLTGVPYFAYGLQQYQGTNYFYQQHFKMKLTDLKANQFSMSLQLIFATDPQIMSICYIAIEPNGFNYYINTFVDVPVNYASSLTNFSIKSSQIKYHCETIDYTQQTLTYPSFGPRSPNRTFQTPFSRYRIALFLTSFGTNATANVFLFFNVTTNILSSSTYQINVTMGTQAFINFIDYSQIYYDTYDYPTANNFYFQYAQIQIPDSSKGAFYPYDYTNLQTNFIMTLKQFGTLGAQCAFSYKWLNKNINGVDGASLEPSVLPQANDCGFTTSFSTVLLYQQRKCPIAFPYYQQISKLCYDACGLKTYLNASNNNCYYCSNQLCLSCSASDPSICITCPTNWELYNNTCICNMTTTLYVRVINTCFVCHDYQPYCSTCSYTGDVTIAYSSSSFTCLSCNASAGYFLDNNKNCMYCFITNCLSCFNSTLCATCASGYYINSLGGCTFCPLTGCSECLSTTACLTCSSPSYYKNLPTLTCVTSCAYYSYLNSSDRTCRPCTNTLCLTCNPLDPSKCLSCPTNWQLSNNNCICNTSAGTYLYINGICYSCGNSEPHCTLCVYSQATNLPYNSASFTCLTCDSSKGYFINPSDKCVGCSVSNCVTCIGYATCSVCAAGYGITDTGSCSTCPLSGCQTCASVTQCSVCKTGYSLMPDKTCKTCSLSCNCQGYTLPRYANGDCSTVCGDNIKIFPYEECDDGNSVDGDGCSSSCAIEDYSSCSGSPSVCYFNSAITAALVSSAVSEQTCNLITLRFRLSPYLALYNKNSIDWYDVLQPVGSQISSADIQVYEGKGEVSISFFLTTDLQDRSLSFKLLPQNLGSANYLRYATPSTFSFTVVPSNNIPALYLDESQCSGMTKLQTWEKIETSVSYVGLFMSLFSGKIVGLQMFGLLQLTYFSMSNYDYVPSSLKGLLNRKQINGLNVRNLAEQVPSRVSTNGIKQSDFLANINVMFLVMVIVAVLGLIAYIITYFLLNYCGDKKPKAKKNQTLQARQAREQKQVSDVKMKERASFWHRISRYILKQVLLTFIIFNMFNISFSAGMQIKYINEQINTFSIISLLISLFITIAVSVALLFSEKQEFGEYVHKFKQDKLQSKYMIVTIAYRFSLGILMALINQWIFSGLVYVFVSGLFLAYICYCEPFVSAIQNIRSKAVHSAHILVLFINFYYRMQANADTSEATGLSVPAYIQISVIAIIVIGSLVLLVIQFIQRIRQCCSDQKKQGVLDESQSRQPMEKQMKDNVVFTQV